MGEVDVDHEGSVVGNSARVRARHSERCMGRK